jgi:ATP-dependent Zn protease
MLVCASGLGINKGLLWTRAATPAQEKQIDQLLRTSYKSVVGRLRSHRALLDEVARLLVEKQELGGAELRKLTETQLADSNAAQNGKAKKSKSIAMENVELM